MASMIALLEEHEELVLGNVLPIDRYLTNPRELTAVSRGGTLYLVASGPNQALFLVAALEEPQRSRIKKGDTRPDGWYAPANVVPVTDISTLRKVLKLSKTRQAKLLAEPIEITKAQEQQLRASFDEADAPVIEMAAAHGAGIERAIEELLAIWLRTRAVEVADLIERASRFLPRADHPLLASHDEGVEHETWMRVWNDEAQRAVAMPRLVQNLFIQWNRRIEVRLEAIANAEPDPRIARQIARHVQTINEPEKARSGAKLVKDARDATAWLAVAGMIDELEDHWGVVRRNSYAFTLKTPDTAPLTDEEQLRVRAIDGQVAQLEADRTEWELVDAIAEHPEDDDAYLVYADWLQNQQHPRGEYIALACQKRTKGLSAALARRLAALENIPYLAGPFDDLATTRRRPNPRGIDRDLDVMWSATELMWREAARHPLAHAIRRLSLVGMPLEQRLEGIATFAEAAPKLRQVDLLSRTVANRLAKRLGAQWRADGDSVVRR